MARQPTPIVVVSACVEAGDLKISMNALKAGALVVVEKPAGGTRADYAALARRLRRQLLIMSEVPVIRRRGASDRPSGLARDRSPRPGGSYDAVGIVASTGGPNAVTRVLQALDASFPVPIFLVQHITASFVEGFVLWLDENAPLTVLIAKDHEKPLPAHVYVAPAGGHLEFDGTRLRVTGGAPQCGQRPSGTVLLRSMARSLGSRAIGMVLTGMGDDGADGLRAISDAGGYTIAEDRSTSVVYGMPKAAVERGAVQKQLPLQDIGRSLTALLTAPADIAS